MKKFFTLLTVATMSLIANAYPVTITVDDASHIDRLEYDGQTYIFSSNTLELEADAKVAATLYFADSWALDPSSYYQYKFPEKEDLYNDKPSGNYQASVQLPLNLYAACEWGKYFINTVNIDELRTESFTVNVHGDPEKVFLMYSVTNYRPKLVEGKNELKFWWKEGTPLVITSAGMDYDLYQVWVNGENFVDSDFDWGLLLNDGDVIDIYTEWPDEDVSVTLSLKGDASYADIISYQINGVTPPDPTVPYPAKMGQTFYIRFNTTLKEITCLMINGEQWDMGMNGTYETRLTGDFNFEVTMEKVPCWTATVTVDNPSHIRYNVAGGRNYNPKENTFEIDYPMDSPSIVTFERRDNSCELVLVELDGKTQSTDPDKCYIYLTKDGLNINISTKEVDRNESLIFYFDSPEKSSDETKGLYGWWVLLNNSPYQQEIQDNVKAGYNEIAFSAGECPFEFGVNSFNVEQWVYVYLNNEAWTLGPEDKGWSFTPADNDVLKMYIADEAGVAPERSDVKFTVAEPGAVVSTLVDGVNEVSVSNDMVIADQLPGTLFEMALARGYEVLVNDVRIEPDEDGVCSFEVNGDLNVNVRKDAGIEDVTVTETITDAPIYNLMGVKVSDGSTDNLPTGIYVSKGAKIRVK